ncbi:MAG: SIR2 family protein, partial [Nitrososphaeraceae archaeon]
MAIELRFPLYRMMLLLGAGASKSFGIPTTKNMADEFLNSIETDSTRKNLEKSHGRDIEDIIRYLTATGRKTLERRAYSFIKDKCRKYEREKAKQTYAPILNLSKSLSLNIFSTNYDTILEDTCNELRFSFDDGFISSRDMRKFDQNSFFRSKIQIFKMHGSISWYKDESSQTVFRFPLELTQSKDIKEMMIYPTRDKDVFTFPFYIFQSYFWGLLNEVDELVSIGHRFNDSHILAAVKATLAIRTNFRLVIVNPEATKIKERCFETEDDQRVVAVDKNFEEWVGSIQNEYSQRAREFVQRSKEYEAKKAQAIIAEYRQTDHFQKDVADICR